MVLPSEVQRKMIVGGGCAKEKPGIRLYRKEGGAVMSTSGEVCMPDQTRTRGVDARPD